MRTKGLIAVILALASALLYVLGIFLKAAWEWCTTS